MKKQKKAETTAKKTKIQQSVKLNNNNTDKKVHKIHQVKAYLIANKSITSWQAIELFGATRLSALIFIYKKSGMKITTERVSLVDRNGNNCTIAKYHYKK